MKKTLLLLIFTLITAVSKAQDFTYGTFKQEDINMKSYALDTSAHAVVLNEYGNSLINETNDEYIKLIYTYHIKIKIFDNSGYGEGKVEIPIYNNDDDTEDVENIKGITTYTDDNGLIKTVELDPKKVYRSIDNKHWSILKFVMPGIKNGCIIEYSYTIYSRFFENFHSWYFQSDIPKIHSEYEVHIPGFWNYNAALTGPLRLTTNKAEVEKDCFSSGGAKCDCSHIIYAIDNVPAFIEEADMTSAKNFKSAINFELSEFQNPYDGIKHSMAKEWKDVDYTLIHDDDFGGQLKRTSLLKERITPIIAGETDDLKKAKIIYQYIQKNMKWNDFNAIESEGGIKKALDNHTGNIADINISLTTALTAAGLDAQPVLLSTRDNGAINKLYPMITGFNYTITKVTIGDKSYFLDASDPLLPFGMLPLKCINDQGRVMNIDKPSYWVDMTTPQKRNSTYQFNLTLQPDGKIKGTMIHYSMGYEAYLKRKEIKKFNSVDEYVEDMDTKSLKFKILKSDIVGIDSLDGPIAETYEIEIQAYKNTDHDHLTFDPFIINRLVTNPYKLVDRNYPVDIGMPSTDRYTLTLHLPDGYVIDNAPQTKNIKLPNSGGNFITDYHADDTGTSFTFSNVIQFNKSIYQSVEYPYLKEFFNEVILSEKGELTFKKKS
ncbi:DUF3857 domain-containing protein [Mucilaginibacter sp.]